jgi:hypothetical protein
LKTPVPHPDEVIHAPSDLCWRPGLARNIGIAEMPCAVARW